MDDERQPVASITPFGLRMQPTLKARIEADARANNRSLNAEIVARLQGNDEGDLPEAKDIIKTLLALVEHLRNPDSRSRGLDPLLYPSIEVHARLFLEGRPVRQMQDVQQWARLLRTLPNEPGLDDSDRQRLEKELQDAIDYLLKPVIEYLRSTGWDVTPPAK